MENIFFIKFITAFLFKALHMLKIKLYGVLKEKVGGEIKMESKFKKIEDVINFLIKKSPYIGEIREHLLISINNKQASFDDIIKDGDEISIFLAPSGG